jgi:hypothetical protein
MGRIPAWDESLGRIGVCFRFVNRALYRRWVRLGKNEGNQFSRDYPGRCLQQDFDHNIIYTLDLVVKSL